MEDRHPRLLLGLGLALGFGAAADLLFPPGPIAEARQAATPLAGEPPPPRVRPQPDDGIDCHSPSSVDPGFFPTEIGAAGPEFDPVPEFDPGFAPGPEPAPGRIAGEEGDPGFVIRFPPCASPPEDVPSTDPTARPNRP